MAIPVVEAAAKDAVISFLFIFVGSTAGAIVILLAPYIGEDETSNLILLLSIIAIQIVIFGVIAQALGGASFNPTGNLANYWLGQGGETVVSMGLKVPAQVAGGVLGAIAISELMPDEYKHTLSGPKLGPGVDMWTGAIAEGGFTLIITYVVLWIFLAGPKSMALKTVLLITSVITMIILGAPYSGPAMNPLLAFSWAYVTKTHNTPEHFYVYWLAPTIGTILASVLFSVTLHPARRAKRGKPGKPVVVGGRVVAATAELNGKEDKAMEKAEVEEVEEEKEMDDSGKEKTS